MRPGLPDPAKARREHRAHRHRACLASSLAAALEPQPRPGSPPAVPELAKAAAATPGSATPPRQPRRSPAVLERR
ncbi:hypothetical protein ACU686_39685 [Yinghuangia aomiensis]